MSFRFFASVCAPAALIALSACAQDETAPVDNDVAPGTVQQDTSLADETEEGPTRARDLSEIPERFRGIWDRPEGSCEQYSNFRVEIGAQEVAFYESTGEVQALRMETDDALVVTLAMSGEGQSWEQTTRLKLSSDGERLSIEDSQDPGEDATDVRRRCDA